MNGIAWLGAHWLVSNGAAGADVNVLLFVALVVLLLPLLASVASRILEVVSFVLGWAIAIALGLLLLASFAP